MQTDIEISKKAKLKNIITIAKKLGLKKTDIILYGDRKAKIKKLDYQPKKDSNLILVTAINPTASGNGKTTVSIGLADAFTLKNISVCLALREPSLGPVFGMKGGATGGGYSQIVPMEDINLHFNGDFHAITSANNLLCSLIDNSIFQGNPLNIDYNKILFNRCIDLNDRALREITVCQSNNATPRRDGFVITAASEIMAIMCLSKSLEDLKQRLANITVALNFNGEPVYARDLKAENAMTILLKDALRPNLVQTLAGTPAIVHCGPFANIAHGCNSIIATKTALSLSDYCITEAGFGADLGAEKFVDVKCRVAELAPKCIVLVATIKALKLNGGANKTDLDKQDLEATRLGLSNLEAHINAIKNVYKIPLVVTLNKFSTDTEKEQNIVRDFVLSLNCEFAINNVWAEGGKGALELCSKVINLCNKKSQLNFCYNIKDSVKQKIKKIAENIYGAKNVVYEEKAEESLKIINKLKLNHYPIVMAKTQYSLSDNAQLLGCPKDFDITVRDIEIKTGARFLVIVLGKIMLMPALSKEPAATKMLINNDENIFGLF